MGMRNPRLALAAHIRRAGESRAAFARSAGVLPSMITLWIQGKRVPGLRSAHLLEQAAGIPAEAWVKKRRTVPVRLEVKP